MSSGHFVLLQTQFINALTVSSRCLPKQIFSRVADYIVIKTPRNIIKTPFFKEDNHVL